MQCFHTAASLIVVHNILMRIFRAHRVSLQNARPRKPLAKQVAEYARKQQRSAEADGKHGDEHPYLKRCVSVGEIGPDKAQDAHQTSRIHMLAIS